MHQQANEICQYLIGNLSVGPITYEAFKKHQQTAPITIIHQKIRSLYEDYLYTPIHYIYDAMYTFLAIHRFRPDSVVATLPRDVAKLIVVAILETKRDQEWLDM